MDMNSYQRLLTIKEASHILQLTPITLYDIHKGTLRAVKFGRYYRILLEDLKVFIEKHTTDSYVK